MDSAYNERRAQCEQAARTLGVKWLREATTELLASHAAALDPVTLRRARHVISEDDRTLAAVEASRAGDVARLGRLVDESHLSLRDDFEVSSAALDAMVACARREPGCVGARMTGAGFGGCALALVERDAVEAFIVAVTRTYSSETGLTPALYACTPSAGASVTPL